MRSLQKSPPPATLTVWRAANPNEKPFSSLSSLAKQGIQAALIRDQQGLCAYCESRIAESGPSAVRVEHWHAQATAPEHALDWQNMLGVCQSQDRCEGIRGATPLSINPYRQPNVATLFRYRRDGAMVGTTEPAVADAETLHLNHPQLMQNREAVYQKVQEQLTRIRGNSSALARFRQRWETSDSSRQLLEYVSCAMFHLNRWTRSRQGPRD